MNPKVEKAKITDVAQIHKLINYFAAKNKMLPRSLTDLYENLRDYFVIRENDKTVACAALHINWADLAEIKGLAVAEEMQQQDLGSVLVKACVQEGTAMGIQTIFCLTYEPEFFENHGFVQVEKKDLPHKVWGECQRCPKFPDCDEVGMIYAANP
ncbi:MAG: N-acetyltransferase [Chloroflexi bacterium]|jgi:amino-acid N-acetyltransferase|nr:N-acetyltransferase [Chloroflexota bacterium]MBT7081477.1 N-acetyltransferase [Chloroflexota bacterium]MBT7289758.1 N-acetyltransferase [Chloroflexota bacterium]